MPGLMQSYGAAYTEKVCHCERSEAIQGSIAGLLRQGFALLAMTTLSKELIEISIRSSHLFA